MQLPEESVPEQPYTEVLPTVKKMKGDLYSMNGDK